MLVVLVNDFNAFYCLLVMVWWGVLLFAMQGIWLPCRAYGCHAGHMVAMQGIGCLADQMVVMQGTSEVGRAYLPLLLNRSFR